MDALILILISAFAVFIGWVYIRSQKLVEAFLHDNGYKIISLDLQMVHRRKSPFPLRPYSNVRIYHAEIQKQNGDLSKAWIRCGEPYPKNLTSMFKITIEHYN
jgi:hypothetical protein